MDENQSTPTASITLAEYVELTAPADVLGPELPPILQGLFGEVGGIMATAKKHVRDRGAFPGYRKAAVEEFGDALWYFGALCRRVGESLEVLFLRAAEDERFPTLVAATDLPGGAIARIAMPVEKPLLDAALFRLGRAATALIDQPADKNQLLDFCSSYMDALRATNLPFSVVARTNIQKVRGAFLEPALETLVDYDEQFSVEEQLPRYFEIRINQRSSGKSYLRWNNVFIGDPLTDNIADADGYRYHDVFHFAYAAILHWSPVMRALIRHKRKSRPEFDEDQDGGRAIVIEEGLSAWIFSRAKELNYFDGQERVSLSILKTISEFVRGYEIEQCPLKLWERAILHGFTVFRQIRDNDGGWVIGSRDDRSIRYKPLDWKQ